MATAPYRPPQWAYLQDATSMYAMIVPGGTAAGATPSTVSASKGTSTPNTVSFDLTSTPVDQTSPVTTPDVYYVFDAVLRAGHNLRLRPTENPIQTGANMSDHAIVLPVVITLEIGMSDALDAFNANWGDLQHKSVSCFQTMVALQRSRVLFTLATRLSQYTNMLLINIRVQDDAQTLSGLRAELTFQQIFLGSISTVAPVVSARQDVTNSNNAGSTQALTALGNASLFANVATTSNTSSLPLVGGLSPLSSFPVSGSPLGI